MRDTRPQKVPVSVFVCLCVGRLAAETKPAHARREDREEAARENKVNRISIPLAGAGWRVPLSVTPLETMSPPSTTTRADCARARISFSAMRHDHDV